MVLCIIMVLCISCRQLFCLLYILNAVVSCFVHLMCPKQLPIAFFLFPLLLSLLLALIKVTFAMVMLYEILCKKLFYVKKRAKYKTSLHLTLYVSIFPFP